MGFPKYAEDNFEIWQDRLYMQRRYTEERGKSSEQRQETKRVEEKEVLIDQYITCMDCGQKIIFSKKQQIQFAKKGWKAPKRCSRCKQHREILQTMKRYY